MLVYDWRLALIAFFAAAPLVLLLRVVQRHLVHAYSQVRERNAELLTSVSELVTGAAVIRAYRIGPRTTAETRTSIDRHRSASIRAGTIAAFLFPSGELFSVLTIAAVLVAGTAMGPDAGLTTGAMVGFIFLCYRFLEPVAEFTEILDQTQTAVAGWRRVLGDPRAPDHHHGSRRRVRAAAGGAVHRARPRHVPVPGPARAGRRGQQARAARRDLRHRARHGGGRGRRHGLRQDHPRPAAHPPRRPRARAPSASVASSSGT